MGARIMLALTFAGIALAGCSKSATVTGEADKKLTLKEPASVTLERGGMAKAEINITRHDLAGEVSISFSGLPKGVEVVDSANNIVGDQGTYTLRASDSADLVEKSVAHVKATGAGPIAVSQPITITVKAKK